MRDLEERLERWQAAGLIDAATASAIARFEQAAQPPEHRQWQVRLALLLGGILLGAGVLLFVAAHWNALSPFARTLVVLATLSALHLAGAAASGRFPALSTAMHAVGTVAAGGAIALLGQIFNMNEHWPAAVLLWALCAVAGAMLLGDGFQRALAFLLVPAWLVCEWIELTHFRAGATQVYLGRFLLVLGCIYVSAYVKEKQGAFAGILFAAGVLAVPVGVVFLAEGWRAGWGWPGHPPLGLTGKLAAWAVILAVAAAAAWLRPPSRIPTAAALVLALALPWLIVSTQHSVPSLIATQTWTEQHPGVLFYLLLAAGAAALVYAGVREHARALVNFGTVAFGAVVLWFYSASLWDKLGRSLGLVLMGLLFLLGGWLLERTRRKLLLQMEAQ